MNSTIRKGDGQGIESKGEMNNKYQNPKSKIKTD